jgi:N-hydroxyarylamine O-acetyltransferase
VVDAWVTRELGTTEDYPIDFVMANHYTSTHPNSPFTQRLMLRAFVDGDKVTVTGRDVTMGGVVRQLADRADLHDVLVRYFGFDLDVSGLRVPSIPEWA